MTVQSKVYTYHILGFQIFYHKHIRVTHKTQSWRHLLSASSLSSLLPLIFTLTQPQPTLLPNSNAKEERCEKWFPLPYRHRSGWSHRAGRWRKPSGSCPPQTQLPGTRFSPPSSGRRRSCSLAPSLWTSGQRPPKRGEGKEAEWCMTVGAFLKGRQSLELKMENTNLKIIHNKFQILFLQHSFIPGITFKNNHFGWTITLQHSWTLCLCVYLFTQVEVNGPDWPTRLLVLVVLQDIRLPAQPTASQHEPTPLPRLEIARDTCYPMQKKLLKRFFFSSSFTFLT